MTAPGFTHVRTGSGGWLDWPRYKAKECWVLAQLLLRRWPGAGRAIALHNSTTGGHFTQAFLCRHAIRADPALEGAGLGSVQQCPGPVRLLALVPGLVLALLPVALICRVLALLLRRRPLAVIYCDAHLSGYCLALAHRRRGTPTATLHHGLYRHDDPVSMVGIRNFVSDRIFLWNTLTRREYETAGIALARLCVVGQYGFDPDVQDAAPRDANRLHLCPPFDQAQIPLFERIAETLAGDFQTGFSLHPLLRQRHARLRPRPIAGLSPLPRVAICGDSGAIMDCLAHGIGVVTIGTRKLAATHLSPGDAAAFTARDWRRAIDSAGRHLGTDRRAFGFEDTGASPELRSKEAQANAARGPNA